MWILSTLEFKWSNINAGSEYQLSGNQSDRYLVSGKETDNLSGNILLDWRDYDSVTGRMNSYDPEDQSMSMSGYAYCGNNPVMMVDPDGRFAWFVPIIASFVSSYVQSGISTKNWGWNSIGQGFASAGFAALGGGIAHQITGLAGSLGASGSLASFAGQTVSSITISGLNNTNVLQGLASTYIGGALGGVKNPALQYATNAVFGGTMGGITNENNGGSFWDGFGQGVANSIISTAIARTANTIGNYIEESRSDQAQLEQQLNISKDKGQQYYKEKPVGDLVYQNPTGDFDKVKQEYNKYDGIIGFLKDRDPINHLKVGQLHFRNLRNTKADGGEPCYEPLQYGFPNITTTKYGTVGIPAGFSIHYDKYDVVLNPIKHLIIDTIYQGKVWGRQ